MSLMTSSGIVLLLLGCYPDTCHKPQQIQRRGSRKFQPRWRKADMASFTRTSLNISNQGGTFLLLSSLTHALFWLQSFPSGSPHVATRAASLRPGYHEVLPARRASLCPDWMPPLLIPVAREPIRAQLLWLHAHGLCAASKKKGGT